MFSDIWWNPLVNKKKKLYHQQKITAPLGLLIQKKKKEKQKMVYAFWSVNHFPYQAHTPFATITCLLPSAITTIAAKTTTASRLFVNFCWFWNGFSIFLFLIKVYIYIYILRKDYFMSKGHEGAKKITKDYVWKYKSENVAIESQCAKPHP